MLSHTRESGGSDPSAMLCELHIHSFRLSRWNICIFMGAGAETRKSDYVIKNEDGSAK